MCKLRCKFDKVYDKLCNRCVKCPFYYYTRGYEDCDEGCEIKGYDWDSGLCVNMFIPKFILKIKYKMFVRKQQKLYEDYEKKMIKKANECPKKCEECYWEDCEFIREDFKG